MIENGKTIKKKEKEYFIYMIVLDMKVNFLNGEKEGKGITYYKDGDKYDGEWKNNKKEEEYFILVVVIGMKVNGKMICLMEKEYFIMKMVIERWEIF